MFHVDETYGVVKILLLEVLANVYAIDYTWKIRSDWPCVNSVAGGCDLVVGRYQRNQLSPIQSDM